MLNIKLSFVLRFLVLLVALILSIKNLQTNASRSYTKKSPTIYDKSELNDCQCKCKCLPPPSSSQVESASFASNDDSHLNINNNHNQQKWIASISPQSSPQFMSKPVRHGSAKTGPNSIKEIIESLLTKIKTEDWNNDNENQSIQQQKENSFEVIVEDGKNVS